MIDKEGRDVEYVGDLHGQVDTLVSFFNAHGEIGSEKGTNSDALITALFALKELYPDNIDLLRGNHEDYETNVCYGYYDEMSNKLGEKEVRDMHIYYNYVFSYMSVVHLCDCVLAMHGCIPKKRLVKLENINKGVPKFLWSPPARSMAHDILWGDPSWAETPPEPPKKGDSYRGPEIVESQMTQFYEDQKTDRFVKLMVRAHQHERNGYEIFRGGRVVSIFTATNYEIDKHPNHGAVMCKSKDFVITFNILVPVVFPATGITPDFALASRLKAVFVHNGGNFHTAFKGLCDNTVKKPDDSSQTERPEDEKFHR